EGDARADHDVDLALAFAFAFARPVERRQRWWKRGQQRRPGDRGLMSTLDRGVTIAGYRVDGVLGVGGMGVVYRATQLSLNRLVALKVLAAELSDDRAFRERFQREGQLQAA